MQTEVTFDPLFGIAEQSIAQVDVEGRKSLDSWLYRPATLDGRSRSDANRLEPLRPLDSPSYAVSQFNLGVKFALGQGVGRDPSEAVHWYRRAAQLGSAHAQNNLGTIYATGDGVPINHKEAAEWYRRAAEQNHAKAQYNMVLQQNLWARLCCGKSARV